MPKAAEPAANPNPNPNPAEVVEDEPHPDAAYIKGGPGDDGDEPGAAKKTAKLKIGGKEFDAPEDIAAALTALQEAHDAELAELRKANRAQPAPNPTPAKTEEEPYDFNTMIFINPAEALAKFREEIIADMTGRYQAETGRAKFWSDFNKENSDLEDATFLVESVLNKNYEDLKGLPADEARKELAKLSRLALDKLGFKGKKDDEIKPNRTEIEGGSTPASKKTVQQEKVDVTSIGAVIKAQQARRRKAASSS